MLKERERVLTEAESAVAAAKASLEMTIELEVKRRVNAKEEVLFFSVFFFYIFIRFYILPGPYGMITISQCFNPIEGPSLTE